MAVIQRTIWTKYAASYEGAHGASSRFGVSSSRLHLAQYQWNQEYRGSEHPERIKVKDHRSSDSSAEDKGDPDFTEKAYLGVENS